MTRIILNRTILGVMFFYTICILIGIFLKLKIKNEDYYTVFKDLLPFIFALPAAYLVFCFQRRNEYLKALRTVYSLLIQVNTEFMEYTYYNKQCQKKYIKLKFCTSKAIEEIRSVYENIDEVFGISDGLYPFEPLKEMYLDDIDELHNGDFSEGNNEIIRKKHYSKWKKIRINFIVELERTQAAFPITKFKRRKKSFNQKIINKSNKLKNNFIGKVVHT
ncbi:hypothetical protein J0383_10390 [Flavobacterium endoglycinae]|uniref:SMODS-associated NUDIX domain-containing protein n=1 Tax=Flavobacterium endoglycinae TaxID=2816357 RepID=A0ABX7QJC1_9FLAO|nr:hypothetical protein [Flavobacterium endoglycinae]QSW91190.1 hypothetical protein J0383_10390 [Flavobacterium endoglycinae]